MFLLEHQRWRKGTGARGSYSPARGTGDRWLVADVPTSKQPWWGQAGYILGPRELYRLEIWQAIKKLLHPACQALKTGFEESLNPVYLHFVCQWFFLSRHCLEGELEEGMESSLEVGSKPQFPEAQKLHQKENTVDIVKLNSGKRPGCSFQC